ncbi:aldose epimerase family protein [Mariniflexile sp. HNIBRBA6329]|uniref:aldose epimerase family protein n=1 Tax=Mariniflexile sp. HNIBRBA6329 TaxID=3373088 RepID=UPI0037464F56
MSISHENLVQLSPHLSIKREKWGCVDGKDVWLYHLTNLNGITISITNYGGIVTSILTPDFSGEFENIVLGFDHLEQYQKENTPYMGAIIGRYANRISNASFVLDEKKYHLANNDYPNHIHGGKKGFDKVVWEASDMSTNNSVALVLQYLSKDMEEGYPGNLNVKVIFELDNNNEFKISYEAKTDQPTVVNLTHHGYFNLTGNKENILDHEVTIFADYITKTNAEWIPTGDIVPVANTDFDFTSPRKIKERIHNLPNGYNVNFVIRKEDDKKLTKAASVFDSNSGRVLEVFTTEPGLQLYTGDYLDGSIKGSKNVVLNKNMGLCLEAQHFPDSPNKYNFPSTTLKPGENYNQITIYKFFLKK